MIKTNMSDSKLTPGSRVVVVDVRSPNLNRHGQVVREDTTESIVWIRWDDTDTEQPIRAEALKRDGD